MNSFEQNTNIREKLAQIVENLTHIVNGTQVIPAIEKDIILQNLREAYVAVMQYDSSAALAESLVQKSEPAAPQSIRLNYIQAEPSSENPGTTDQPQTARPQLTPQPEPFFVQPERQQPQFVPNFVKPEAVPPQPGQHTAQSEPVRTQNAPASELGDLFPFDKPKYDPPKAEPVAVKPEPEQPKAEPVVVKPEPEQPKAEPVAIKPELEQPKAEPVAVKPEPEQPKAEPVAVKPEPEQPKAEPVVKPTLENRLFPFDTPRPEPVKSEPAAVAPQPVQPQTEQPKRSLNDLLTQQHEDHSLGAQFQHAKITDISKAMSLNDKFLYIRVLFNGKGEDFALAIQKLNQSKSLDEAMSEIGLMRRYYKWDEANEAYISFCDLVNRKFL